MCTLEYFTPQVAGGKVPQDRLRPEGIGGASFVTVAARHCASFALPSVRVWRGWGAF